MVRADPKLAMGNTAPGTYSDVEKNMKGEVSRKAWTEESPRAKAQGVEKCMVAVVKT